MRRVHRGESVAGGASTRPITEAPNRHRNERSLDARDCPKKQYPGCGRDELEHDGLGFVQECE